MKRPEPRPPRLRRGLWVVVGVAVLVTAGLLLRYERPHDVDVFRVAPAALAVTVVGPGTLDAVNRITVSASIQGRLTEIVPDVGDTVRAGSILARLESADLSSQLAAAEATAAAAGHAVQKAGSAWDKAEAANANLAAIRDRKATLADKGIVSRQDFEAAAAAARQAEAELAQAANAIEQARAEAETAAANVRVVRAQFERTVVRAPFTGVVAARDSNVGDILVPGASIAELIDPATMILTGRFDESAMAAIRQGQAASVAFASLPSQPIDGRVFRLGRTVDTETRELGVDIRLESLPANWALGQRGTARITTATLSGVLAVPQSFLTWRDGRPGLWLVTGHRARWQPVRLGAVGSDLVEITAGLSDGDVVAAPDGVFSFMRVTPREAAS